MKPLRTPTAPASRSFSSASAEGQTRPVGTLTPPALDMDGFCERLINHMDYIDNNNNRYMVINGY